MTSIKNDFQGFLTAFWTPQIHECSCALTCSMYANDPALFRTLLISESTFEGSSTEQSTRLLRTNSTEFSGKFMFSAPSEWISNSMPNFIALLSSNPCKDEFGSIAITFVPLLKYLKLAPYPAPISKITFGWFSNNIFFALHNGRAYTHQLTKKMNR